MTFREFAQAQVANACQRLYCLGVMVDWRPLPCDLGTMRSMIDTALHTMRTKPPLDFFQFVVRFFVQAVVVVNAWALMFTIRAYGCGATEGTLQDCRQVCG